MDFLKKLKDNSYYRTFYGIKAPESNNKEKSKEALKVRVALHRRLGEIEESSLFDEDYEKIQTHAKAIRLGLYLQKDAEWYIARNDERKYIQSLLDLITFMDEFMTMPKRDF